MSLLKIGVCVARYKANCSSDCWNSNTKVVDKEHECGMREAEAGCWQSELESVVDFGMISCPPGRKSCDRTVIG